MVGFGPRFGFGMNCQYDVTVGLVIAHISDDFDPLTPPRRTLRSHIDSYVGGRTPERERTRLPPMGENIEKQKGPESRNSCIDS